MNLNFSQTFNPFLPHQHKFIEFHIFCRRSSKDVEVVRSKNVPSSSSFNLFLDLIKYFHAFHIKKQREMRILLDFQNHLLRLTFRIFRIFEKLLIQVPIVCYIPPSSTQKWNTQKNVYESNSKAHLYLLRSPKSSTKRSEKSSLLLFCVTEERRKEKVSFSPWNLSTPKIKA